VTCAPQRLWIWLWLGLWAGGALAQEEYHLGPGDVVKVLVYEHDDLTTTGKISQGGTLVMPLLGEVRIGGLSTSQAEATIARALEEGGYVKFPQVALAVEEYRSQQFAILGHVKNPSKYPIEGKLTLIDALAMAGGTTDRAADVITVVSRQDGRKKVRRVDLTAFYRGDLSQNVPIKAGDVILVPKMETFYIYGEVRNPGSYRLEKNMTVVQALSVGGGLTDKGTQRGIRVKRQGDNGTVKEFEVGLNDLLRPNDVVFVKEGIF